MFATLILPSFTLCVVLCSVHFYVFICLIAIVAVCLQTNKVDYYYFLLCNFPVPTVPRELNIIITIIADTIGRVSYLIYVSMRHYVLTTSSDIVVCFHTAVCLSC